MLLTFLLIKGVPGRKPYLAYDISFGETKGKLLPKNFIPHLIDGFLNGMRFGLTSSGECVAVPHRDIPPALVKG